MKERQIKLFNYVRPGNITVTYDDVQTLFTVSESLTTTDITEGDNLYFTNARVESTFRW